MTASETRRLAKTSLAWRVAGAMLLGLLIGQVYRPQCIDAVIFLALFLMLYPPMLEVDFPGIKNVLRVPRLVGVALLLNFLVSPLLIFGMGHLFLGQSGLHLMLGLFLYGSVPGGGMAPAFTGMLRGNVNLSVTISSIGSIFTLGMVPFWAKFLMGTQMAVPALLIFRHLCFIIVIPLVLAALTRRIILGTTSEATFLMVKERIRGLSGVGLCLLIFTMALLYGDQVLYEPFLALSIAGPVFAFLITLFYISSLVGKMLCPCYEDAIALTLSTTAKNNAISLALAFSTFGPDVALVNAIAGPLVQMPLLLGFVALKGGPMQQTT